MVVRFYQGQFLLQDNLQDNITVHHKGALVSDIHTVDFIGRKLRDVYHSEDGEALTMEFDNGFKIIVKGIRNPGNNFVFKKERIGDEPEDLKEKKQKAKKRALNERKLKESKQKNRKKEK